MLSRFRFLFKNRDRPFGFMVGRGVVFFQLNSLKLGGKSDKVKESIFCNHKVFSIIAISPLIHVLISVSSSMFKILIKITN